MRKFLDEVGASSDEGEREGQEGEGGTEGEPEDKSMANIDARIERLREQEAAEEKR